MGKVYKLFSSSVTDTNGAAQLRVTKRCRIRTIYWSGMAEAGAAVDNTLLHELSKQNSQQAIVNDSANVLSTGTFAGSVSGGGTSINVSIPCDIPVDVGDTLYLNAVTIGSTSWAGVRLNCFLYTDE